MNLRVYLSYKMVPGRKLEFLRCFHQWIFLLHIFMYSYAMNNLYIHIVVWTMSLPWHIKNTLGRWYIVSTRLLKFIQI